MKIYLGTCDGGGFYQDCHVLLKRHILTKMPARMVELTGKVCFSFFWDALGGKNKNLDIKNSSLKEV